MAPGQGLEPRLLDLESSVLPVELPGYLDHQLGGTDGTRTHTLQRDKLRLYLN